MPYPFTPEGVTLKTEELYGLSDAALLAESRKASEDISTWLDENFTLSDRQRDYISTAPDTVRFTWGTSIALALILRGTIIMQPVPQQYGPPHRTKQISIDIDGTNQYAPPVTGTGSIAGTITLKINYVLVD